MRTFQISGTFPQIGIFETCRPYVGLVLYVILRKNIEIEMERNFWSHQK